MTSTTLTRIAAAALAALTLVTPVAAQAVDPYVNQVSVQLRQVYRAYNRGDSYADRGQHIGKLNRGGRYERLMFLDRDEEYVFAAACDSDCDQVRLRIYDQNGALVAERRTNQPIATIAPPRPGTYRIQLDMTGCRQAECHFGVALLAH